MTAMHFKIIKYPAATGNKKVASLVDETEFAILHLYTNSSIDLVRKRKVLLFGQPNSQLSKGELLRAMGLAEAFARKEGYEEMVGPIEGSTWNNYRTILAHSGDSFPGDVVSNGSLSTVLLEGMKGEETTFGFTCIETYASCEISKLQVANYLLKTPEPPAYNTLFFESVAATDFLEKVASLFEMVSLTFSRNQLYSPIEKNEFLALYGPLSTLGKDGLLQVAKLENEEVGFALFLEDADTLVVKTLGRLPGKTLAEKGLPSAQLGAAMARKCYEHFMESGKNRFVMALMHEGNPSYAWAIANGGKVFARYGLFSKLLE